MKDKLEILHALVLRRGIVTRLEITQALGWSNSTLTLVLRNSSVRSSINHNARFYTLLNEEDFDEHGLWEQDGIRFGREGSMTKTMVAAIVRSKAGMNRCEVKSIFGPAAIPSLTGLCKKGLLVMVKCDGKNVYFAPDAQLRTAQEQQRMKAVYAANPVDPKLVIALLGVVIEHPNDSKEILAQHLKQKGVEMASHLFERIWNEYDLDKKKRCRSD